ncbi:hypothetical protein Tco_0464030, partial [Tanacetum coccineum]
MEILRRESQLEKMVLLEYFHQYLLQKFMLLKRKGRQEPSYLWPYVNAQNVAFVSHSKSITNKVKSGHTGV